MAIGKKQDEDFYVLLTQSAENTLQAAHVFRQAMMSEGSPTVYQQELRDLEHKGDTITHSVFRGLNKVFITPIDREDILALAAKMDDVIDGIEECIARFDYLNIQATDHYMKEFSVVLVNACQYILDAIKLLSKKKYMQIAEFTVKINSMENEGDKLLRQGIKDIFHNPKDPYHDFKLKEMYEQLELTTDACENVADILDGIVLKYA
jgi:predicted phosphate transport protein (TIGR00153 family)